MFSFIKRNVLSVVHRMFTSAKTVRRATAKLESVRPGASTSIVSVTSVPEGVVAGAVIVIVPSARPVLLRVTLLGDDNLKVRSFLARTVTVPLRWVEVTVKGISNATPGFMLAVV